MKLTAKQVRRLVDYNTDTGVLIWRERPLSMFKDRRSQRKWNARFAGATAGNSNGNGYLRMAVDYKKVFVHRVIWLYTHGGWPKREIDHINGDRSDNRLVNLREATTAENMQNPRKMKKSNTSGYPGVCWQKHAMRWAAQIMVNYRRIHLGLFDTAEEAYRAYIVAKQRYHTFHPYSLSPSAGVAA